MAKKTFALNTGVGLFVDTETGLTVVPGVEVEIDTALASEKTLTAIRHQCLVEVEKKKGKEVTEKSDLGLDNDKK